MRVFNYDLHYLVRCLLDKGQNICSKPTLQEHQSMIKSTKKID